MPDDASRGSRNGPNDQGPGGPGEDSFERLLASIVDTVESGGTASLAALVADSDAVESMDEFLQRLRRFEGLSDMEATAVVNAAYGETVEAVRDAVSSEQPEPAGSQPDPATEEFPALAELQGADNVLVLTPSGADIDDDLCRSLLTQNPPGEQDVLIVSITGDENDRLELLRENDRTLPANVAVVGGRSGVSATSTVATDDAATTITLETMPDPSDLPKLGIKISQRVKEWEGDPRATDVCFHSLTALLQYAGSRRVFRFIRVLEDRLAAVDATTHYHMDPDAHDRETVSTLRSLFDDVVEVTPDGTVRVTG